MTKQLTTAKITAQTRKELRNVTCEMVVIDDKMAKELLKLNTENRKFSKSTCRQLEIALGLGHWVCNGDTIKISKTNVLLDGQHRLQAVVNTGIPVVGIVVRGLDPGVMETLDNGKTRTVGDILSLLGYKNHNQLAATLKAINPFLIGEGRLVAKGKQDKFTASIALEVLDDNPSVIEDVSFAMNNHKLTALTASALASVRYLITRAGGERGHKFINQFVTGAGLTADSPVLTVRNYLNYMKMENKRLKSHSSMTIRYVCSCLIKAWNAEIQGVELTLKELQTSEEYPTPIEI